MREAPVGLLSRGRHSPGLHVPLTTIWVGEGAYDALLLVGESTFSDGTISLDGHIIESDLPSLPVRG